MTGDLWVLVGFFVFMLAAITVTGYIFILRPMQPNARAGEIPAALAMPEPEGSITRGVLIGAFRLIGAAMPGAQAESNPLRRRLAAAGHRWPSSVSIFYGIKCASALVLGLAGGWAAILYRDDTASAIMPFACAFGFGYLFPDRVLDRIIAARKGRLRRALPAAIDLMILAIEAGQALDQAVLDASRGLKKAFPDLAAEFMLMHLELRASSSRADVIHNFAARNNDPELRKFASLLLDTDRFGTSLGPALRTHAKYLRIHFRQVAQEKARKIGVKLIFPVFFLIFPSVLLVTLGPAVILISTQMKHLVSM
ncbi:MAG TPA: type II secretion system F family protein [Bryobacteraceae bacterium]|nr:type II secretion system F family protein [Bryobacteraceae bacterium]